MTSSIEMEDLAARRRTEATNEEPVPEEPDHHSEIISMWTYTSAGLLSLIGLVLIFSPQFLLFLASEDVAASHLTPLESFLSRHFGILLFAVAGALLFNVPDSMVIATTSNGPSHPLLVPVTLASSLTAFLSYNTKDLGSLATIFFLGPGVIALWGFWVMVFGAMPEKVHGKHGVSRIFKKEQKMKL
ncbi:hypothetical protein C8J56DRAFT_1057455 [Mycena floridula]|nr:hypothetical protein C8J56DRAFT_1057455 [Mycena floridula]